jgi:hypothetical protein
VKRYIASLPSFFSFMQSVRIHFSGQPPPNASGCARGDEWNVNRKKRVNTTRQMMTDKSVTIPLENSVESRAEIKIVNKELPAAMQYRNMKLSPPKVIFLFLFLLFNLFMIIFILKFIFFFQNFSFQILSLEIRNIFITFSFLKVQILRSNIHGWGVFTTQHISADEMIIEYVGEVIRNILADKREKYYEARGIGCYMFRVDSEYIIDATMRGGLGRFINHSCSPNSYTRVINLDRQNRIVIMASVDIPPNTEVVYDYHFPIEAESEKIKCLCGASNCRGFMNYEVKDEKN